VTDNPGTAIAPLDSIQSGINAAKEKYGNDAAEVRVALCSEANPYSASCKVYNVSPYQAAVFVVDMEPGISLYGGYATDFMTRDYSATPSYIKDTATSAIHSAENNPAAAVRMTGAAINAATIMDGFWITIGASAASSNVHCGISCLDGATPTIRNVTIRGRSSAEENDISFGVFISSASPSIQYCDIDPGESTTSSTGISSFGSATACTPMIEHSTINGGKAKYTWAILLKQEVNATVSNNTINGGEWEIATGGAGHCIYLLTMSSTGSSILSNVFSYFSSSHSSTYGVYIGDSFPASNPYAMTGNDFNYDGYWYALEAISPFPLTSIPTTTIVNTSL
jgi:hypothetical protein